MKELQEKLVENLKGYKFEELVDMMNKQTVPEVREAIMNAMEQYHEEKFLSWMEEY